MDSKDFLSGFNHKHKKLYVFVTCIFFLLEVLVTFGRPLRVGLPTRIYVDLIPID